MMSLSFIRKNYETAVTWLVCFCSTSLFILIAQDNIYKIIVTDRGCHLYFIYGSIALGLVLPMFLMTETARQLREERSKCWIITRYGLPKYYIKMVLSCVLSSVSYAFVQHMGILFFTTISIKDITVYSYMISIIAKSMYFVILSLGIRILRCFGCSGSLSACVLFVLAVIDYISGEIPVCGSSIIFNCAFDVICAIPHLLVLGGWVVLLVFLAGFSTQLLWEERS